MMQRRQGNVMMSLRVASQFLETNRDRLSSVYASGARTRLNDIITELEEQLATQASSVYLAEGETKRYYALRIALRRDHMAPLAKVAASALTELPALAPFRLPLKRLTAEQLNAYARGMAAAAVPYKEIFISAGLAEDFLQKMTDAADIMMASVNRRRQIRAERTGATQAIRSLSAQGRKVVHVLDAFVQSAVHEDSALLQAWDMAKRVDLTGTRSARGATNAESAPQPTNAEAPVTAAAVPIRALATVAHEVRTFPRRLLDAAVAAPRRFPSLSRVFHQVSDAEYALADTDTNEPNPAPVVLIQD